jgi:hypothetical protein
MKLNEIFKDKLLLLPKSIPLNKTYRELIKDILSDYIQLIASIEPKIIVIKGLIKPINFSNILNIQMKVVEGILQTIDYYFAGQPARAYTTFAENINYRNDKYKKLLNIKVINIDENFYRIRTKIENFPMPASEMFHIPFELRGKVNTQCYSIPGFPCLYMGKTIYAAWEELKRPSLDSFQVVRLKSVKKLKLLNLTSEDLAYNCSLFN